MKKNHKSQKEAIRGGTMKDQRKKIIQKQKELLCKARKKQR